MSNVQIGRTTEAQEELKVRISAFRPMLMGYFVRLRASLADPAFEVEDVVQETMERAFAKLDQFQDGRNLKSWVFTIGRNIFFSIRRRRATARNNRIEVSEHLSERVEETEPEALDEAVRDTDRLVAIIESLSARERGVLEAMAAGQSHADVAEQFGFPTPGACRSFANRTREKIRNRYLER